MKTGIDGNNHTIELEISSNVFIPSVASTALLYAVDDEDIKGKAIADPGCGSGYLGLGLLLRGAKSLFGIDIQSEAVQAAQENARKNHLEKRAVFRTGTFEEMKPKKNSIDVIVSNPPQTPSSLACGNHMSDGGEDGNKYVLQILEKSHEWLKPDGILYIPVFSYSNPDGTKRAAAECFENVKITASHDIMFDCRRLALSGIFENIYKKGKGCHVIHCGHPYWKIEILRCQYPKES